MTAILAVPVTTRLKSQAEVETPGQETSTPGQEGSVASQVVTLVATPTSPTVVAVAAFANLGAREFCEPSQSVRKYFWSIWREWKTRRAVRDALIRRANSSVFHVPQIDKIVG